MSDHTPGPWKVETSSWDFTEYWTVETEDGVEICMEPTDFAAYESGAFITPGGEVANARLIAAAPDLLDACRQLICALETDDPNELACGIFSADAAIAKAKGDTDANV